MSVTSSALDVARSAPRGAVFLSYASQDAEAVLRIAEALRAAGVEVWFDQDELVGGDAWDAKIRGQIGSCALFVPVISAVTQARLEGYFRLEWKLAAQRTHTMADEKTFLLPVVIDATRDADAKVPMEFKAVQWTRLLGGDGAEKFCARVGKLLGGESVVAGSDVGARLVRAQDEGRGRTTPLRKPARAWLVPAIIGVTAVLALALWQPWRAKEKPLSPISPAASIAPAAPLSETQKLLAQINTIGAKQGDATHDELVLAEDLGAQVVAKEPTNADGWAAYAQATIARAYFDSDVSRQAPALSRAQRAVSLAGEAFEPRFALAKAYRGRPTTHEEGLRLLQQLVRERPDDRRIWRELASALNAEGRYDEALAAIDHAIALPGGDPYAWNTRSGILLNAGRTEEAMAAAERSLALHVGPKALMGKGYIQVFVRDDFDAAAATIDQIPGSFLIREFETWAYGSFWLNARQPEKCLARFRAFDGDFVIGRPKGYYMGRALEMTSRAEAAQLEWRAALRLVEIKLGAQANDPELLVWKTMLLACLGEKDAAERMLPLVRQLDLPDGELPVPIILARLGRNEEAIAELEARWSNSSSRFAREARTTVLHDAFFDPLRGNPRFQAFVEKIRNDPRFPIPEKKPALSSIAPSALPTPDNKSVAVLAFANLSDDKANEYFSDGISEELLNVLAKVPGLKVSARTSAFYFKGKEVPIPDIAKQLGVAYVVEGSVRKQGDKVRITAQLIKAADGFHVWSDTFTRDLKDIFAVQDEIAGLIAQNLQLKLGMKSAPRVVNPEAFALFLQGRAIINRGVPDDHAKGIQCFKDSLALDGGSALTWAWLATSYGTAAAQNTMPAAPAWALAREAVNRALALDPEVVEGHYALGSLQFLADWDWARADASLQHALLLAPGDASTLGQASNLAAALGQGERAVQLGRQAVALDPLNYFPAFVLGKAYFRTGRYAEMEKLAEQMIAVNAAGRFGPLFLAFARLLQGRVATAAQAAEQMEPGAFQLMCLALVRHAQGRGAESDAALNELKARDVQSRGYLIAEVYAYRGEADQAFQWLENSYRTRDSGLTWLVGDPFMQSLHGDTRWAALLKKMNLPDSPAR